MERTTMRSSLHSRVLGPWLLGTVLMAVSGCATVELEPGEAYVLSRLGYSEGVLIRGLSFRNADTGEDVLIKPGRAVLTRVQPGRYYMRRIESAYDNVINSTAEQPEALIPVEAGKVNYIGSWAVIKTTEQQSKVFYSLGHDYPRDVVEDAQRTSGAVFALYPVVEARPELTRVGSGEDPGD